jgi:flagellar hook protein FlgE
MSLYGAMFSGVSALNAHSQALGMISDNISNVNTVGYKTSEAAFSTLVTRQTGNFYAPGGVRSAVTSSIDRQGLLQASPNATDLAISGDGFFVVAGTSQPSSSDLRYFTRAGQFSTDAEGYLRSPSGQYLQGWRTDNQGVPLASNLSVLSNLESIRVSATSGVANPTTSIDMGANLPATASTGDTHLTNVQVFDALGVAHDLTFTWTKQAAANTWTLDVSAADAGSVETGTVGSGTNYTGISVVFNSDGTPNSFDGVVGGTMPDIALGTWSSGASDSIISLDFGTSGAIGTALTDGVTQFGDSYTVGFVNQNGTQFGNFFGVTVDEEGIVTALYDNGETLPIFMIPVATFPNANGLDARSGTLYTQSQESGDYILRQPGEANAGQVISTALEASTADLADEFTNMIITQRAYTASTRIITTADEMLDDLIRIKR